MRAISKSLIMAQECAAMQKSAHDMFLHHTDGDTKMCGDFRMGIALQLVHDECLTARCRERVEINGELGEIALHIHAFGGIVGEIGFVESLEIHSPLPLPALAIGKVDRRMACCSEKVAFRMIHRCARLTAGKLQIGILNDFLTIVPIADEA